MDSKPRKYPLVSVGLTVYNRADTLARAFDTLLAQDYPNLEILVSDNASSDGSSEICTRYAAKDNRIRLNLNPENYGKVANFEKVRRMARGKYFMWAGSDDYWEPGFISALTTALEENPQAAVAQCAIKRIWDDGSFKDLIRYNGPYNPNRLNRYEQMRALLNPRFFPLKHNIFLCGLIRADILRKMIESEFDIHYMDDRSILSFLAMGHRFCYVDEVLFIKTMYHGDFFARNPSDHYALTARNVWAHPLSVITFSHSLWRNPVVPKEHRRWIPALMLPLLVHTSKLRVKRFYQRGIKENFYLTGSRVKRMLGIPPRTVS